MGMGIHGEPGVWNGPVKTADDLAAESLDTLLKDMPVASGEEVALLINGLGATSVEELYILSNSVSKILADNGRRFRFDYEGRRRNQGHAGPAGQHAFLLPEVRRCQDE